VEAHVSPWSRNPDPDDDFDIVVDRPRRSVRVRTLPGDRMRRGARTLRWCALLLAALTTLGQALMVYAVGDEPGFDPYGSGWGRFGQFMSGLSWGLGIAALVLGASYVVAGYASRLDLERALAEE
jgi:hypothetical protein